MLKKMLVQSPTRILGLEPVIQVPLTKNLESTARNPKSKSVESLDVFGKLPTYPSPIKAIINNYFSLRANVGLREVYLGSFPEMYNDPDCLG